MKPLAFVALRTEGPDGDSDDLLEIAVARAEPLEAEPSDVYTARVRPSRGRAALSHGGGVWLTDAMDRVRELTRGCVLAAWDAHATRGFLDSVCRHWMTLPLDLAPGCIDLRSLAWPAALASDPANVHFRDLCGALDVAFTPGACALEDLRALADIYRRVVRHAVVTAGANADERAILETIAGRMSEGRRVYGPWRVDDGRNNPREALAEVMDALNYCAAELVRLSKVGDA